MDFLTLMSEIAEKRVLIVHDAGLPDEESEALNRKIRTLLESLGFVVEIAADTSEAAERLRRQNWALLIAHALHWATCTDAMTQVLDTLQEEPNRTKPGTLVVVRGLCDVPPATTYSRTNTMLMISPFNPQELRSFVQRVLDRPDLRRNASSSD